MHTKIPFMVGLVLASVLAGCAQQAQRTGFLSDYAKLEQAGSTRLRYIGPEVKHYDKLLIDPVTTVFYDKQRGDEVKPEDIAHLEQFMYGAMRDALAERYTLVSQPGPGVARVRLAITNLKAATPALNVIPHTKLTGLGLGQASAEFEMVDSQSGKQVAAGIDSATGNVLSLSGLSKWGDVEAVMKDWAKIIRERLDEARIPAPQQ